MAVAAGSSVMLAGHKDCVWCGSFYSNAAYIATCSSDESVIIWGLEPGEAKGKAVGHLNDHEGVVRGCAFSPDSTLLASGSWDKSVRIYTSSNFMLHNQLYGHSYGVSCVKFSPGGQSLVSCSWDDTIGVWDLQKGTLVTWLREHTSPVSSCTFLQGGTYLASCSWDRTVKVWDMSRMDQSVMTLKGHPCVIHDISASSPEPHFLASCGRKGTLILWDIRAQGPWQCLQSGPWVELNAVCFSPDGSHFVTGDNLGELQCWNMAAIKQSSINTTKPVALQAHASSVNGLTYSEDGSALASCSSDFTCHVWDTKCAFQPSFSVASLADTLETQLCLGNS